MRVLMVCLGNICRSPLAQGILERKVLQYELNWEVDSAGTSSWHIGEGPDGRSVAIAKEHEIDISHQRSRQISPEDLDYYDLILAMDVSNYQNIRDLSSRKSHHDKIKMVLNYVYPGQNRAVPDPYYNGGFQRVFDLLDEALEKVISVHG